MERADLIVVTKADGDLARAARLAQTDYASALQLMRPRSAAWRPQVLSVSAMEKKGLAELWSAIAAYREAMGKGGDLARRRAGQNRAWLWREVSEGLLDELRADPKVAALLPELEAAVDRGELAPGAAARRLLAACFSRAPELGRGAGFAYNRAAPPRDGAGLLLPLKFEVLSWPAVAP